MPSTRLDRILASVGLVAALALAGFTIPAVLDYRSSGPDTSADATALPSATTAVETTPATTTAETRQQETRPTTTAAAADAELELVAARGDCWLHVREGSADGRSLFAGILAAGASRRFSAQALWIEIGAPGALDVMLNDRPVTTLPQAPTTVIVTARGVRSIEA